jgi:hypothetical protein
MVDVKNHLNYLLVLPAQEILFAPTALNEKPFSMVSCFLSQRNGAAAFFFFDAKL